MKNSILFKNKYDNIFETKHDILKHEFENIHYRENLNNVYLRLIAQFSKQIKTIEEEKIIKLTLEVFSKNTSKLIGSNLLELVEKFLDQKLEQLLEDENQLHKRKQIIEQIALYFSLKQIKSNLNANRDTYAFMIKLNDFSEFTINDIYDVNRTLTEKLRLKIYPEKNKIKNIKRRKDYSKDIEDTKEYLNMFDDNEKKYLLKAFYNYLSRNFNKNAYSDFKTIIPATEFAKLTLIISNIKEPDIFYKTADKSSISKNITAEWTKPEIKALRNLTAKLDKHNMKQTKAYINGLIDK
jgi:hypothetical protein